jgi:SAM-dependent methyltransferase
MTNEAALSVAKENLTQVKNVSFHADSVGEMPPNVRSPDFAFSPGVLHHEPDTRAAISAIAQRLRPGAPFLILLYYALDNRPAWYCGLSQTANLTRLIISRMPAPARLIFSELIVACVYWPIARAARFLLKFGLSAQSLPLSYYADKTFYVMRTDAYDRFYTRREKHFSRIKMGQMLKRAELRRRAVFRPSAVLCAVGVKSGNATAL